MDEKRCIWCNQFKAVSEFYWTGKRYRSHCNFCHAEYNREWYRSHPDRAKDVRTKWLGGCREHIREMERNRRHTQGINRPMSEAKECSLYLGVHIAERVLSNFFNHVERLPHGSVGGDLICGNGFLIDVKSSCIIYRKGHSPRWQFDIRRNKVADYFLCIAFDNRESLEPQHIWLIPGAQINNLKGLAITVKPDSLAKWSRYEKSLDRVIEGCDYLRSLSGLV